MSELPTESTVSRRTIITSATGAAAGLGLLVACGSTTGGSADGAAATGGSGSGSTGSGSTGTALAALADIGVGRAVAARVGRQPVVVSRPTQDTVAAFSAICTHMGCTVNVVGAMLDCPCHGSQYNALTGAVTRGPAVRNLESIPVQVVNGEVMTT